MRLCGVGGQRVVVFVGSPITEDDRTLVKIGKLLKKNNVRGGGVFAVASGAGDFGSHSHLMRQIAVDVISMGEVDANAAKLQVFVDAANSNSNRCV